MEPRVLFSLVFCLTSLLCHIRGDYTTESPSYTTTEDRQYSLLHEEKKSQATKKLQKYFPGIKDYSLVNKADVNGLVNVLETFERKKRIPQPLPTNADRASYFENLDSGDIVDIFRKISELSQTKEDNLQARIPSVTIAPMKNKSRVLQPRVYRFGNFGLPILGDTHRSKSPAMKTPKLQAPNQDDSSEILKQIFRSVSFNENEKDDRLKNALVTKVKSYHISKLSGKPSNFLVVKNENTSIGLSYLDENKRLTNYTDTHTTNLQKILGSEYFIHNDGVETEESRSASSESKENNYDDGDDNKRNVDFVSGVNMGNRGKGIGMGESQDFNNKGPSMFVDGTFVDGGMLENTQSATEDQHNTHLPSLEEMATTDESTEDNNSLLGSTLDRDIFDDMTNSENIVDVVATTPSSRTTLIESADATESADEDAEISEQFDEEDGTLSIIGKFGEKNGTAVTVTGVLEKERNNDVTGIPPEYDYSGESRSTETDTVLGDSSVIHPSTINGPGGVTEVTENSIEMDEDDSTEEFSDVEIYAGPGGSNGPNVVMPHINSENPDIIEPNDQDNATQQKPDHKEELNEYLTELCFPISDSEKVSLLDLLSGNFFFETEGKRFAVTLKENPMQNCTSGTKVCKLYLEFVDKLQSKYSALNSSKAKDTLNRKLTKRQVEEEILKIAKHRCESKNGDAEQIKDHTNVHDKNDQKNDAPEAFLGSKGPQELDTVETIVNPNHQEIVKRDASQILNVLKSEPLSHNKNSTNQSSEFITKSSQFKTPFTKSLRNRINSLNRNRNYEELSRPAEKENRHSTVSGNGEPKHKNVDKSPHQKTLPDQELPNLIKMLNQKLLMEDISRSSTGDDSYPTLLSEGEEILVKKRVPRTIHVYDNSGGKEGTCGCSQMLSKALKPLPNYDDFVSKRLDILTNIAHSIKDWSVQTRK